VSLYKKFYDVILYMKYNNIINNSSHYGDILAIPFFALLVYYFYMIQDKSIIEYILFYFSICGFVLDIVYTYMFLSRSKWKGS
jgi:hypothetical protein